MPELAEVETVARSLKKYLINRKIQRVSIADPKLRTFSRREIHGRTIRDVFRSGKEIVIDLSSAKSPLWFCVHLRMTGRLIWWDGHSPFERKHLRAVFTLDRGKLHYFDSRRFGTMRLCHRAEEWAPPGVEPLSKEFTVKKLAELLSSSKTSIKPWLLRQDRIVGFGNIYASEVLFAAGIDPRRPARSLNADEIRRLHRATRHILRKAIRYGGTTIFDFMDCDGECGGYQRFLAVYGRAGEPCPGCGGDVERIVQQGRSTFFCLKCQT